ncbi:hypothetical protein AVEN_43015-1 [Araneus ventricosus]|uniref:Reverse transcriptase domain-containing protein n=1 Tax=Araneus ventricosus TaxID=182803 RepID=A0A4Y2VP65_ARAVE|nr:hypothetical protein AVEN_43015-1 [Araneus ventricosus]
MSRGCPQGSKLAPFLWNLIANSILTYPWECNTHLQAYADDFLFLINVPSRKLLEVRYSDAPMQFDDWVLETPVSKTTAMVFGKPRPFTNRNPVFKLRNNSIKIFPTLNHLGVIFDQRFFWMTHVRNLKSKCIKHLAVIYRFPPKKQE